MSEEPGDGAKVVDIRAEHHVGGECEREIRIVNNRKPSWSLENASQQSQFAGKQAKAQHRQSIARKAEPLLCYGKNCIRVFDQLSKQQRLEQQWSQDL